MNDWARVVLDLSHHRSGVDFWSAVLGAEVGPPRHRHREPVHVDFEVDDIVAETVRLVALGAVEISTAEARRTLRSPGGLLFCVTSRSPHGPRPGPVGPVGQRVRLMQVSIDAPADLADRETDFWRAATGWRFSASRGSFIGKLHPRTGSPVQLLLHRLTPDDPGVATRAHLDLGCDDYHAAAELMTSLGAERLWDGDGWVTLRDPAGMLFCVTENSPDAP